MARTYSTAPLLFQGQKRGFVRLYRDIINTLPDDAVILDLFGGSGLLSRIAKDIKPSATVIYNDYDYYVDRLDDIERTNYILGQLRSVLSRYKRFERICDADKQIIVDMLKTHNNDKPVDYKTLGANLLFSGKFASSFNDLCRMTFYNSVISGCYVSDNYLDGLIVTHGDYMDIYRQYQSLDNIVLVLDPPYLSTDATSYNMRWTLKDYIGVLHLLTNKYIYFSSAKSGIIELCNALSDFGVVNPFVGATMYTRNITINTQATYKDIMICKI